MKYLNLLFAYSLLGLFSINSANATLLGYSSCSVTNGCLIAPDDIAIPNPIVKDPNNGYLIGWDEVQNHTLTSDLWVNRIADPSASFVGFDLERGYFIKAGTVVSSHYFQWDASNGSSTVNARMSFDSEIFAFITSDANLFDSDKFLGLDGYDYANFGLRGLENEDTTNFAPSGDNSLVDIKWTASSPGDWTRLITAYSPAAEIPEPSSFALLALGLFGLSSIRWCKRT